MKSAYLGKQRQPQIKANANAWLVVLPRLNAEELM